jgi:hypothetical protein
VARVSGRTYKYADHDKDVYFQTDVDKPPTWMYEWSSNRFPNWPQSEYNPLGNNCNTFVSWVMRQAGLTDTSLPGLYPGNSTPDPAPKNLYHGQRPWHTSPH